jgi:hypothetical protein
VRAFAGLSQGFARFSSLRRLVDRAPSQASSPAPAGYKSASICSAGIRFDSIRFDS